MMGMNWPSDNNYDIAEQVMAGAVVKATVVTSALEAGEPDEAMMLQGASLKFLLGALSPEARSAALYMGRLLVHDKKVVHALASSVLEELKKADKIVSDGWNPGDPLPPSF